MLLSGIRSSDSSHQRIVVVLQQFASTDIKFPAGIPNAPVTRGLVGLQSKLFLAKMGIDSNSEPLPTSPACQPFCHHPQNKAKRYQCDQDLLIANSVNWLITADLYHKLTFIAKEINTITQHFMVYFQCLHSQLFLACEPVSC